MDSVFKEGNKETSHSFNKKGYNCLMNYTGYFTTIQKNSTYVYYLIVLKKPNDITVEP